MVSELAPVVLYLRHVVSLDDLLIIDEPESHLHPAMQVAFTRQIAAIAGAGVRILLTTHSEWVLEALGNVVGRAGLPDRGARDKAAESFWTPTASECGCSNRPSPAAASTVREIALDADTGLYPSGFDRRRIGPAQRLGGDRQPARRRGVSGFAHEVLQTDRPPLPGRRHRQGRVQERCCRTRPPPAPSSISTQTRIAVGAGERSVRLPVLRGPEPGRADRNQRNSEPNVVRAARANSRPAPTRRTACSPVIARSSAGPCWCPRACDAGSRLT